ncbi:MAG: glycosyltransferase family 4 protein [Candidatus Omnitrophota bacterium]
MKICMIFPTYPPNYQVDGIGDYTEALVQKLRERGHDVFVITSGRYAGTDGKVIKIGGGEWRFRELIKVFKRIRKEKFDVVNMQYTPVTYGFGMSFKFLPLLVKLSAHDILFVTTFHTLVGGGFISKINAALLTIFSHRIISTHEELTRLFKKWLGVFRGKLSQIPIGPNILPVSVDADRIRQELKKKYGIAESTTVLINFGFPSPGKGLETLCDAMKILSRKGQYCLIFLGAVRDEHVEYQHELKGIIMRQGLEKEIIWIGGVGDETVSEILQASDICVLPYEDGISIRRGSLMAAMVHGLPIVSTFPRVEVPYFKEKENVLLVRPGDGKALAEAIEELSRDDALREKLSRNITETAKEFDWDKIADETLEVYLRRGSNL